MAHRHGDLDDSSDLFIFRDIGGPGPDSYPGTTGKDVYDGAGGSDQIHGDKGNDTLHGGADGDGIHGDGGNDRLYGDTGDDWLWGDTGRDILTGGSGMDGFGFATGFGKDRIKDFDAKGFDDRQDYIDLSDVNSITDFADLVKHHMKQHGDNVVIDAGHGDIVTLEHVKIRDLDSGDFIIF